MPPIQDQDSRPLLLQGPSLGLRLAILAVLSVALMVADHRQDYLETVRGLLAAAVYPVVWLVDAPSSAYSWTRETLRSRSALLAENTRLEAENLSLGVRLMRLDALEKENQRLRAAREGSARVAERFVVAEILKVDLDPFRQRVLVDKGASDGVFGGQAALDARGVFGQVTRVGPVSAEIIMISDPEHFTPVQINRTGVRTIAVGTGRPEDLHLPFLPRNADVEEGDLVVTSGLGGVFPPGYPVANIVGVRRDPAEPLLEVAAVPLAELDRDPEVLLVWFDNRVVEPPEEDPLPPQPTVSTAAGNSTVPRPPQPTDSTAAGNGTVPRPPQPTDATAAGHGTPPRTPPAEAGRPPGAATDPAETGGE